MGAVGGIHPTGLWVDLATGDVVGEEPERGIQLVPKGGQITPDVAKAIVDAGGSIDAPDVETTVTPDDAETADASADDVETTVDDGAVETATSSTRRGRSSAKA